MATWNSRGLRGLALEEIINMTISQYRENKLALIQKIPTPIKPIEIEQKSRHIKLAYFEKKSTVDYIGVVQGVPVCFDAKECATDTFPIANIHKHQIEFMKEWEEQDGIAFLIVYFTARNEAFYVPFRHIYKFYERSISGGRKSFKYEELEKKYLINQSRNAHLHFLESVQIDLNER